VDGAIHAFLAFIESHLHCGFFGLLIGLTVFELVFHSLKISSVSVLREHQADGLRVLVGPKRLHGHYDTS
jgi:hypothetical protein